MVSGWWLLLCWGVQADLDLDLRTVTQVHEQFVQLEFITESIVVGNKPGQAVDLVMNWGDIMADANAGNTISLVNSTIFTSAFADNNTDWIYIPKNATTFQYVVNASAEVNVMPFLWLWQSTPTLALNFVTGSIKSSEFRPDNFALADPNSLALDAMPLLCFEGLLKHRSPFMCPLTMKWGATPVLVYLIPGLRHIVVPVSLTGPLDRDNHDCFVLDTRLADGPLTVCSDDLMFTGELPRYVLVTAEASGIALPDGTSIAFGTNTDVYPLTVYLYSLAGPRMLVGKAWVSPLCLDATRIVCIFFMVALWTAWAVWGNPLDRSLVTDKLLPLNTLAIAKVTSILITCFSYGLFAFVLWFNIYTTALEARVFRSSLSLDVHRSGLIFWLMMGGFHGFFAIALWFTFIGRDHLTLAIQQVRTVAYLSCGMLAWSALMVGGTELSGDMIANLTVSVPFIYLTTTAIIEYVRMPAKTWRDYGAGLGGALAYGLVLPFVVTVNLNSLVAYIQDFHGFELSLCLVFYFTIVERSLAISLS